MILCPGCGGRNDPGADVCAFCQLRVVSSSSTPRTSLRRNVLLAVLIGLVIVLSFLVIRSMASAGVVSP